MENLIKEECKPEILEMIYNGIEVVPEVSTHDKIKAKLNLGLKSDAFIIVCVANLTAHKGHKDLLLALNLIRNDLPSDWKLLCLGRDRGEYEDLVSLVKQCNFESHVLLLGSVEDIGEYLKASDIGVLVSYREGFSNSVLEYMSYGLPTVVSDVGGNGEAITHGEEGFVVRPKDVDEIGKYVLALSGSSELRAYMSQNARCKVIREFNIEKCVENYDAMYKKVLGND